MRISVISVGKGQPGNYRDGLGKGGRHPGCDCRGRGAGDRDRVRSDRTNGQACKTDEGRTAGTAGPCASGQGAGGERGAAVSLTRKADRGPLAKRPDRPYVAYNGDVDAS